MIAYRDRTEVEAEQKMLEEVGLFLFFVFFSPLLLLQNFDEILLSLE